VTAHNMQNTPLRKVRVTIYQLAATMWASYSDGPRCPSVCHSRISPKLGKIDDAH